MRKADLRDGAVLWRAVREQRRDVGTRCGTGHGPSGGRGPRPGAHRRDHRRAVVDGDVRLLLWLGVLAVVFAGCPTATGSAPAPASAPPNRPRTASAAADRRVLAPAAAPRRAGCPARWRTSPPATPSGSARQPAVAVRPRRARRSGGQRGGAAAHLGAARAARAARRAAAAAGSRTCSAGRWSGAATTSRSAPRTPPASPPTSSRGLRVLKGIGAETGRGRPLPRRPARTRSAATLRAARAQAWHDGALLALTGLFLASSRWSAAGSPRDGEISVGEPGRRRRPGPVPARAAADVRLGERRVRPGPRLRRTGSPRCSPPRR